MQKLIAYLSWDTNSDHQQKSYAQRPHPPLIPTSTHLACYINATLEITCEIDTTHSNGFPGTEVSLSSHKVLQQGYRVEHLLWQTFFAYIHAPAVDLFLTD